MKAIKRWMILLACAAGAMSVSGGHSQVQATSSANLFLNLNAGDSASYSASTPGTWTDLSSAARNGTIFGSGSVTYNSGTKALTFPGSVNSYVDMGSGFNSFGSGITVEFEGHFGAANQSWERVFDFGNADASDNIWVGVFGESYIPNALAVELWNLNSGQGRCVSPPNTLTTNSFAKYAVTLDGSVCRMYKDGVELQTRVGQCYNAGTCSTAMTGSTYTYLPRNITRTRNYIAKSNWVADPAFNGSLKYVRIYTSALTPSEIQDNAASYTLTYATSGSDTGSAPAARTGNGLISLDGNTGNMVKAGHSFSGWATSVGQSTAISGSYNLTASITLHPVWTANTYTVTYEENGGSTVSDGSFTHGGSLSYPTDPIRSGFTFQGWFAASTGGSALTASAVAAGNASVTLWAQWAVVPTTTTSTTTTTTTTTTTVAPTTTSTTVPTVSTAATVPFATTTTAVARPRAVTTTTSSSTTTSTSTTTTTTIPPTTTTSAPTAEVDPVAQVEEFVGVSTEQVSTLAEEAESARGAAIIVNGKAVPVEVKTTASSVSLSYLNATLEVQCFDKAGNEIDLNGESRFVVRKNDVVRVSVSGFKPGTDVNVAVFSDPTALGTITADAMGTGRQQWQIPASLAPGDHTLVASGDLPEVEDTVFGLRVVIDQKSLVARISSSNTVRVLLVLAVLA
ncbi:MAG: InlB B-repeat-containing protein, partial [Actinomycetota bacterium]